MAWPWLAVIAKNIPWVELARRAPAIVAKSRQLLEESREPSVPVVASSPSVDALRERVEALEARDAEHARLLAAMVEQLQGLTTAVEVLTARNRMLIGATGALLVAFLVAVVWVGIRLSR
jgi:hypothetical protein